MAKFEVTSPIKHDGKEYQVGEGIDLDPKKHQQLIESGAVKEGMSRGVSKKEE